MYRQLYQFPAEDISFVDHNWAFFALIIHVLKGNLNFLWSYFYVLT